MLRSSQSNLETLLRYWNWLVTFCPMWVAPNLITIVGLVINIVTSAVLVINKQSNKHGEKMLKS